jgi:signal transduction histidine kinase/ActR/RegA family two-component response regulator
MPEEDDVLAHIRRGEKVDHFETIRRRKDGSLIPISLTVSPILDANGTVIGASKIARDISERKHADAERARLLAATQEHAEMLEKLNHVGGVVASALNRQTVIDAVTNGARAVTGATFAAFFYNAADEHHQALTLQAVSGAPRDDFADFPSAHAADVFNRLRGIPALRSDDISVDERYAHVEPFDALNSGRLGVRSYLAVPIKARSGEVVGGLFFGHPDAGRFADIHERAAIGMASWAAIALDNAQLYLGAQQANRLKDEFLATLSHELRTPLNAILGYARMVRSGIVTPEKLGRAIGTIERNASSLTQIVEDILDVSRIISGKMRLDVQTVDLPDVVRSAVESVTPAAEAKGIRLETVLDPRASPISGDPARIQQVIWNLLANAVKFTGRGGKVQVRLQRVDSHVEVDVSDTGIGIAPDFLPFVFDRFRQADSSTARERGGLGLGLGIARQLVEMHGGTIEAASPGTDRGSTFRIKLPLMIVHPERAAATATAIASDRDGLAMPTPDLQNVHVLAVDDDRDALVLVRDILEAAGARVSTANSAFDALAALDGDRPDVLVADLGLPRMDGFQLIAEVRRHADDAVRSVPAAALTAYARSEDRARALRSGFHLHLAKPIDPTELMAAVASLARRKR